MAQQVQLAIKRRYSIIQIYMTGVSVHGMYLINVLKSVKGLVLIGGMLIIGTTLHQEMATQ
ncbi:hypothetical protein AZH47_01025 [Corynebacterium striatum]|nr:hypothetical protein AZH47_01025 [Corynebacterium striatum]